MKWMMKWIWIIQIENQKTMVLNMKIASFKPKRKKVFISEHNSWKNLLVNLVLKLLIMKSTTTVMLLTSILKLKLLISTANLTLEMSVVRKFLSRR
ncbi:MAG: hypothetical protein EBY80_13060 [Actinobacteria bacterium]|nr:hypothetical protein [Actinomycetota bacterium]NDA77440.1 hypothetical protein [Actinomycetota bacterium]